MGTGTCWRCGASEDGGYPCVTGVPDSVHVDPRDAEIAALKAERDGARASEASIRASAIRHDDANNETIRVLTKKRDAALAACAEMRAALEAALASYEESGCVPMGPILDLARVLLSRTDLGAGKMLVEREVVERWRKDLDDSALTVAQYGDTIDARVLAAIADLDALLKKGGG